MYKVAAYITAYQDKQALLNCLESLQQQSYALDKIFIVDNSPEQIIDESEQILVEFHPENIGVAGGLNVGVSWAIAQGYDFLWTFDQDSQALPDTLEKLIDFYHLLTQQGKKIGIIGPLPLDPQSGKELPGLVFSNYKFIPFLKQTKDFYYCDVIITSGSLVALDAAKHVDLPRQDLFIDYVDFDYCLKFKQKGYEVILVREALLNHRFGTYLEIKSVFANLFQSIFKQNTVQVYSPLRYYYISRNHTFIETRKASNINYLVQSVVYRLLKLFIYVIKIILFESEHKLLKLWACFLGTYHGFLGKLGKIW